MNETSATRKPQYLRDSETDGPPVRMESHGPAALSDAELLALLLGGTMTRLDRARRLLDRVGGLVGLAGTTAEELATQGPEASDSDAQRIAAALELARRLPSASMPDRDLLNEPRLVKDFLRSVGNDDAQEHTGALFLNARNRLIKHEPAIYRGTLDRAVVEPREILRRGLLHRAAGVILYHNHPSGDPTPSREDREFTRRLNSACEAVGMRLLDHIVVARESCVSFRESGLL
jgi:DNA repair protein RadC